MIHIILRGQIGNQLFQYALGRRLALERGTQLVLDLCNRRRQFQFRARGEGRLLEQLRLPVRLSYFGHLRSSPLGFLSSVPYFKEERWGFDERFLRAPAECLLRGYFQSERYFSRIAERLREELSFEHVDDDDEAARWRTRLRECESVAVHVRRGDYLRLPSHNLCGPAYYERALAQMRERLLNPALFVFSDDLEWCRAQPVFAGAQFVDIGLARINNLVDMRAMACCRHHIIANSTYSWWGAWLADRPGQIVLAPDRWFRDEQMNAAAMRDTVPERWIRIPAT